MIGQAAKKGVIGQQSTRVGQCEALIVAVRVSR